jgi:hypothetical protein
MVQMAKASKKKGARKPSRKVPAEMAQPTDEALQHHEYDMSFVKLDGVAGHARAVMRKVVMIDKLYDAGKLSKRHYDAAGRYRDQFDAQERSLVKSCLANMHGRGGVQSAVDVSAAKLDAQRTVADARAAVGAVADVFALIVEQDYSLSATTMRLHGAREKWVVSTGKFVLEPRAAALERVARDLDVALERLANYFRM